MARSISVGKKPARFDLAQSLSRADAKLLKEMVPADPLPVQEEGVQGEEEETEWAVSTPADHPDDVARAMAAALTIRAAGDEDFDRVWDWVRLVGGEQAFFPREMRTSREAREFCEGFQALVAIDDDGQHVGIAGMRDLSEGQWLLAAFFRPDLFPTQLPRLLPQLLAQLQTRLPEATSFVTFAPDSAVALVCQGLGFELQYMLTRTVTVTQE